jgi:hypothetical protein
LDRAGPQSDFKPKVISTGRPIDQYKSRHPRLKHDPLPVVQDDDNSFSQAVDPGNGPAENAAVNFGRPRLDPNGSLAAGGAAGAVDGCADDRFDAAPHGFDFREFGHALCSTSVNGDPFDGGQVLVVLDRGLAG